MYKIDIKNVSSLEKVMPTATLSADEYNFGSCLLNEEFSYQVAYRTNVSVAHGTKEMKLEIESDIKDDIKIYLVRPVVVNTVKYQEEYDDDYLIETPGLMPDVLEPYSNYIFVSGYNYNAVWVCVKPTAKTKPGKHNIKIKFINPIGNGFEYLGESNFEIEIINKELPKLHIPFTNWFHCDCISSYYDIAPFSDKHWELIDKFMKMASDHGMNMILTPVFTPPLDTKIGSERPTIQLVDVSYKKGKYIFGFQNVTKWLELCKKNNIEYLEISHLFTQWGGTHAPKIEVLELSDDDMHGKMIKKFGWETDSLSDEYKDFITQFITEFKKYITENWDKDKVYFHITDEPNEKQIEYYGKLYKFFKPLVSDFKQMDAMSDLELYEKGYIETPVVSSHAIDIFLDKDIPNLWAYYCCASGKFNLSNRFHAMPSNRNRILGCQLYKYDIKGFLQWGYNFYYSQHSTHLINPFLTTDSDGGFPSGDAFVVYPGLREPMPSLRLKVFHDAFQDLRALKLAESLIGKDEVMKIVEQYGEIDFRTFSRNPNHLLNIRKDINEAIKKNC